MSYVTDCGYPRLEEPNGCAPVRLPARGVGTRARNVGLVGGARWLARCGKLRMYRRPRNRVSRDIAERFITRRLVRRAMIEYEYLSGLANRPRCWLLGHEGPVHRGYILCENCGQKVRARNS